VTPAGRHRRRLRPGAGTAGTTASRVGHAGCLDLKQQAVKDAITPEHPYFHPLAPLLAEVDRIEAEIAAAGRGEKAALKTQLITRKAKFDVARKKLIDAIKARHKQVARAVKELGKLQEERDAREQEVKLAAEREIAHLREASADLLRIAAAKTKRGATSPWSAAKRLPRTSST
jgi:hypothetical protein